MITNVVDHRSNQYLSENLDVFFEPSCHDNNVVGATQFDPDDPNISMVCDSIHDVSILEAIEWGNNYDFPVTMFLYEHNIAGGKSIRGADGKVDKNLLCVQM